MINEKHLRENYSNLSDEELFSILNENSDEYTDEALIIVKEEIEKRKLSENIEDIASDDIDNEPDASSVQRNFTATVIKAIGAVTIFITVTIGLIYFLSGNATGLGIIILGVIVGFLFLGFSEIINLLHQINERQKSK